MTSAVSLFQSRGIKQGPSTESLNASHLFPFSLIAQTLQHRRLVPRGHRSGEGTVSFGEEETPIGAAANPDRFLHLRRPEAGVAGASFLSNPQGERILVKMENNESRMPERAHRQSHTVQHEVNQL